MTEQRIGVAIKDRVPRDKILSRISLLEDLFLRMKKKSGVEELKSCTIDKAILISVVRSYFYDIERLKMFHGIDNADNDKIAAYTVKWICKLKPIYVDPKIDRNKSTLIVNELFAVMVAFNLIQVPKVLISEQMIDKLLYTLTYRSPDEGSLTILFDYFIETHNKHMAALEIVSSIKCSHCGK